MSISLTVTAFPHAAQITTHSSLEENLILESLQSSLDKCSFSLPSDSLREEQLFGKDTLQYVKQLFIFALRN